MGQKVNPNGFRYGITKEHNTNWYSDKANFAKLLLEDQKIYGYFDKLVRKYQIGGVKISRNQKNDVTVVLQSAKVGELLGENKSNLDKIIKEIQKLTRNRKLKLTIDVQAIEKPEINAKLIAEDIAIRLENRGSFRTAQKFAIRNALRAGAKGVKTKVSGRLNGADMARAEGYTQGEMKLHTLRQDVDYATATARTTYGAIGIKVWVSKGEILSGGKK